MWFWWFSGYWDLSFEYVDWVFCVVFICVYVCICFLDFDTRSGWSFHVHKGVYVSGILRLDWVVFFFFGILIMFVLDFWVFTIFGFDWVFTVLCRVYREDMGGP